MTERPSGAKQFQRLLQRHANETGQLPQRVMHLVRVGAVCAMLNDIQHADGGHLFIVKGGTAMQLRLGIQARATTDLDTIFRGRADDWLAAFDQATVNKTWNGFTVGRKTDPKQIEVPGLGYRPWRVALQIRYEGTEFGTTSFEVAIDEQTGGHQDLIESGAIPLGQFSIEQPGLIPCLDIAYQIAQKIHACTEPIEGGNDRVRDIVDIWLLEPLLEPADYPALRSAVAETFQRRARHTWPPPVQPSPSWAADYPKLVASHPEAPATLTDAVAYLTTLIRRIDAPK